MNEILSVLSSKLGIAAAGIAVGAVLAAVNASHLSRLGIEFLRQKLGVDPVAVYAPKTFVEEEADTDDPAIDAPKGEEDG